jgi:hypothetical protein
MKNSEKISENCWILNLIAIFANWGIVCPNKANLITINDNKT